MRPDSSLPTDARVALYLRVSTTTPKNGRAQNPDNQRRQLLDLAKAMRWQVVAEFEDRESGAKSARPGFRAMMEAAARREFDVVLVWSLDRFSREGIAKTFDHLRRLDNYGVGFRSYSESFLDTTGDFQELLKAIFAFVAGFERRRTVERIRAGLERARAEGKELGRPRNVVDRMAVQQLRKEGKSIRSIAQHLGYSKGTVQRVLQTSSERSH